MTSNCCGAEADMLMFETGICPQCREHCEFENNEEEKGNEMILSTKHDIWSHKNGSCNPAEYVEFLEKEVERLSKVAEALQNEFDRIQKNAATAPKTVDCLICKKVTPVTQMANCDVCNQCDEKHQQILKESAEKITSFRQVVAPVIAWLQEHCNPHSVIIVEYDNVQLLSGECGTGQVQVPD